MAAPRKRKAASPAGDKPPAKRRAPRRRASASDKAGRGKTARAKPAADAAGGWLFLLAAAGILAAAFPLLRDGAFLGPLVLWGAATFLAWRWSRPPRFTGDRALVALTCLLLGLGVVLQTRLGTWAESWTAWRAYAPLLAGLAVFLGCLRWLSPDTLVRVLPPMRWVLWLLAVGVIAVLFLFGRPYRGGLFLPGQINPTELAKVALVAFAAAWLPRHAEGLSRTLCGVPFPPVRDAAARAFVWGVPLVGAVLVRDLGLALILCVTACFLLTALTRRPAWLVFGLAAAVAAGFLLHGASAHTAARFDVWLDPFADPDGKGWQIGQALCAQYAGGLWGVGVGQGVPETVPIVANDFVYAAVAEEWGLIGCGLLLLLYWLWLLRLARIGADARSPVLGLLGSGAAALLGTQIILNIAGVTKALPMTGITLPLLSQGGFSLLSVLLLLGLAVAASKGQGR